MDKNWVYAELSKSAKKAGGPEAYAALLKRYGFQKGIMVMLPVSVAGCIITYKKGPQIVNCIKDKLGIVTEADIRYAEEHICEMKKEDTKHEDAV